MSTPFAYIVSSALVNLIVRSRARRRCRRSRSLTRRQMSRVDEVLDAVLLVCVTPAILSSAAALSPLALATLDAIHLATALSLDERPLDVITYDTRLAEAARSHSLTIAAP